ncbi:MAG: hypothetical protein FJW37_04670 [Acidobacteria bacterium]|nr:hypothetical protein [Acidobacteriota bacterium]
MSDAFERLGQALRRGGARAGFEVLAGRFREQKQYPALFELRLLEKRHELGLPLVQTETAAELAPETRRAYDEAFIQAAREVGSLFLADGSIARAWPYFRAIGESAPVAASIEAFCSAEAVPADRRDPAAPSPVAEDAGPGRASEDADAVIEIAFHERVHPRKGYELILKNYGTCRAISFFEQYPDRATREDALALLARTLHQELLAALRRSIEGAEGAAPAPAASAAELIAGRDWLFGEYDYYVDTSHVISVIRFSLDSARPETLEIARDLARYGARLSSMFQFRGEPPFEAGFPDYAIYLDALLRHEVESALAHFRGKLPAPGEDPSAAAAQFLVRLLVRLELYREALDVSLAHLRELGREQLICPTPLELCQLSGDYERMAGLAQEQNDLVSYTAAALQLEQARATSST